MREINGNFFDKITILVISIFTAVIIGLLGMSFLGMFGNLSKNHSGNQEMQVYNFQNEAPRMHVNANNKGMGVAGIKMPFMISSAIHEDVEKNIFLVNPSNEIKLSFEGNPKVVSIKVNHNGVPTEDNAFTGNKFNAPREFGVKLYEAEVQFEGAKYYYPFKIEVTAENQKQMRFGDINPGKIIKLDITKVDRDDTGQKVIQKHEKSFEFLKDKMVGEFRLLVGKAKVNEKIVLDRIPANYEMKIYLNDGTWMKAYYWTNCKEYNLKIENVIGEITTFPAEENGPKRMDDLLKKAFEDENEGKTIEKFANKISGVDGEQAKIVVQTYFDAFAKQDYKTMADLATNYHNKNFIHNGDVWGMKWARAKEISFSHKLNNELYFGVSVDCETVVTSAQYPSKSSYFYMTLVFDEKEKRWKVDKYTTG